VSRGSSVSIVSSYGLEDREIEVRTPAEVKASCPVGTLGPFPGAKARPVCDADHSPPSNAEVENEYDLYLLSPQAPSWRVVVAGLRF
jgi:hypothetical protein